MYITIILFDKVKTSDIISAWGLMNSRMKKRGVFMKKITTIILLVSLLTSCTGNKNVDTDNIQKSDTFQTPTQVEISGKVDELNIYHRKGGSRYNQLDLWSEYIYNKYGVKVNVNYSLGTKIPDDEIFYINYHPYFAKDVYSYINNNDYYSLNKYYEKYGWYDYVDPKYIKSVTIGEDIKALPCVNSILIRPRYYNKLYIDQLGIEAPQSINEFTNYLNEAKKLMVNSDQFPMVIAYQAVTQQTSDIFRGFGLYVGVNEESMIAYNPLTNSYEDATFSEKFSNVHQYFLMLEQSKTISFTRASQLLLLNSDKLATEYNLVYNLFKGSTVDKYIPEYPCVASYYLKGDNQEKLINVRKQLSFYLFPKTISNIDGTVELFNSIIANNNSFYDMKFGIYGTDYNIVDDSIVLNSSGQFIDLNSPIESYSTLSEKEKDLIPYSYESNSLLDVKMLTSLFTIEEKESFNGQFTQKIMNQQIVELFGGHREDTGIISSEDLIAEYKREFLKRNGQNYIHILNEKLGMKSKYKYSLDSE